MTSVYGAQRPSQIVLGLWVGAMIVATYAFSACGLFFVGLTVVTFSDNHFRAWFAEQLGASRTIEDGETLLRHAGAIRYLLAASVGPLLYAGLAVVLLASAEGDRSVKWLGRGMLVGAATTVLTYSLGIYQLSRGRRQRNEQGTA